MLIMLIATKRIVHRFYRNNRDYQARLHRSCCDAMEGSDTRTCGLDGMRCVILTMARGGARHAWRRLVLSYLLVRLGISRWQEATRDLLAAPRSERRETVRADVRRCVLVREHPAVRAEERPEVVRDTRSADYHEHQTGERELRVEQLTVTDGRRDAGDPAQDHRAVVVAAERVLGAGRLHAALGRVERLGDVVSDRVREDGVLSLEDAVGALVLLGGAANAAAGRGHADLGEEELTGAGRGLRELGVDVTRLAADLTPVRDRAGVDLGELGDREAGGRVARGVRCPRHRVSGERDEVGLRRVSGRGRTRRAGEVRAEAATRVLEVGAERERAAGRRLKAAG